MLNINIYQNLKLMSSTNIWDIFNSVKGEKVEKKSNEVIIDEISNDFCSQCKTNTLIYDSGNYFCEKCGLCQSKRLSEEAEYRYYGDVDNKSSNPERVGMPTNILLPKSSLGSLISSKSYFNHNFKKMIKYNTWTSMPYR